MDDDQQRRRGDSRQVADLGALKLAPRPPTIGPHRSVDRRAIQFRTGWSSRAIAVARAPLRTSTAAFSAESWGLIAAGGRPGYEHMGVACRTQAMSATGGAYLGRTSLRTGSRAHLTACAIGAAGAGAVSVGAWTSSLLRA
jgi:hypothetical protein